MKHHTFKAAFVGLAFAVAVPAAHAQATGLYLGAGLGTAQAKKDFTCDGVPVCDDKGTVGKVYAGYQFHRHFAVEVGYTDLGSINASIPGTVEEKFDARLGEGTLLVLYPATDKLQAFGKVGGYYANTKDTVTQAGTTTRASENNGGVTFGLGLQYFVTSNLAIRGDFQRYMKVGGGQFIDIDYNAFTAGALWKF